MKKLTYYSLSLVMLFSFAVVAQEKAEPFIKAEGFSHPESVVLDEKNNVLYISNIGEKVEGDGFISKVGVDGEILELKWITNLNDPKGLLLHNGRLWVSDVTHVVLMDVERGEIIIRIPLEGAESLNDIALGNNGDIYISDLQKSSIYKREESGEIIEWLDSDELQKPNGLLVVDDHVYVASWGNNSVKGNLLRVNLNTKTVETITTSGIGNLDGIQQTPSGDFSISDWNTGKIYKIGKNGNSEEVLVSEKSSGDILFYQQKNQLVLPMNFQNEVWWYQLK